MKTYLKYYCVLFDYPLFMMPQIFVFFNKMVTIRNYDNLILRDVILNGKPLLMYEKFLDRTGRIQLSIIVTTFSILF